LEKKEKDEVEEKRKQLREEKLSKHMQQRR